MSMTTMVTNIFIQLDDCFKAEQNTILDGRVFDLVFIFRAALLLHSRAYEEKKQLGEVEDNCCAQC